MRAARSERAFPAHGYFVVSAILHYLGPAFAVLLFARIDALGVAWLRIALAAVLLACWRRPWRRWAGSDRDTRRLLCAWGAVLAAMNCSFYLAIERLPLGTVAAIEFVPVVVLAAASARTARNVAALGLAVAGVYLLTDVVLDVEPGGVALATANAVLFAAYVVLGHRVARRGAEGADGQRPGAPWTGIDGLALAMLVATVVALPLGGRDAAAALDDPVALLAALGVAVASSVVPYVCDQLAMARLARATYSLLVSLLPATATVVGVVVLAQLPTATEVLGVVLVIAAVAAHQERAQEPAQEREARSAAA